MRRLIDKAIEKVYAKLEAAIGGSLPELVKILYQDGLVGKELISSRNYDEMIKSFLSTLEWDTSVEDLDKDLQNSNVLEAHLNMYANQFNERQSLNFLVRKA